MNVSLYDMLKFRYIFYFEGAIKRLKQIEALVMSSFMDVQAP